MLSCFTSGDVEAQRMFWSFPESPKPTSTRTGSRIKPWVNVTHNSCYPAAIQRDTVVYLPHLRETRPNLHTFSNLFFKVFLR